VLHPYRISLNKTIAEVGLIHEPRPLRQKHVIIHSAFTPTAVFSDSDYHSHYDAYYVIS
jgi:hypothetical protein